MSFKAFIDAAKSIVKIGHSTNAAARQEIINVVGELGDELDRAFSITDSYLVGAKFSIDDAELSRYLADVDGKLMGSYYEHHICAGLYHLADKFQQAFDPAKFSVSISGFREIPTLINELKDGEQVILDDMQDIANKLRNYSSDLMSGAMTREQVLRAIEYHRGEVDQYRKKVRSKKRTLLQKI